ncbi:MAG TPA: HD domain-containing phosphohydrolase [Dehalococcoidales bacterium]|nr:HD domain-containing phosphohydrolase [Dehalococcoidales bacterium]
MYLLIPIIEVIFCLGLLIVLMISGKRHVARRPFAVFLFFMTLWGFFIFMMRASPDIPTALLWERFVFWAILSASLFFYRFTISLTGLRPNKYFMYPLYISYFVVLGLVPTGLVVSGMQMMWYGKAPIVGPLFPLYVLCAYVPIVLSAMLLIKHYRRTRVIDERIRAQYIIVGIASMFIGATTDYLPVLGISMYPLGIIGNILFCLIATISMLRHNLLEMKVVIRKLATYSLTSLLIFCVIGSFIFLLSRFFPNFMSPVTLTITIIAVFLAASLFQPVLSRLQSTVDRWFFRERFDHIQTLRRFNHETKGDLDLEQLSSSLVNAVANGMQSQGVYLLLPSPATGNYATYMYSGRKSRGRLYFSANSPLVATMKQQNNVVDSTDLDVIPSLIGLTDYDRQTLEGNNIELLVPLKNNGHLAGMLLLGNKISRQPYSKEERRLLEMVSADVAVSIDNANLYENMKQKQSELQKAMDGVIHAVSLVVESRDPYTAGHQRRVAELARTIAKEMGLSEWQMMGIHVAGLLHDVGKVAVPSEILSKPGKISENEFNIIKNHCQVGYEILERIDFPWPVTRAILQHHERLDGSGYPQGLSGEDIILDARILGVADVVEAMSSHRPYRPALGLDSALKEISQASGILYDTEVVEACLALLKKNQPEFERIMAAASTDSALETVMK